ncbi:hypersensitive-induced response protein 4-like [Bidens hawaiensis]|uniref:hypersensitive-induced response protein 4-like n=1 Tax=Bidens hawaiensis TaxID=980011 RepID=UPI00404A7465
MDNRSADAGGERWLELSVDCRGSAAGGRRMQDNVFVQISSSIQYRVINQSADDAFYELQNPAKQIQAYVFCVVRAQVPRMTLDQLFEQKDEVAKIVLEEPKKVMGEFGYTIEHILMVDIIPDPSVRIAMNEINAA